MVVFEYDLSGEGLEISADRLETFVADFRRHVDDGWIDALTEEVRLGRSQESLGEAWHLLRGLQQVPAMLSAMRQGVSPTDPWLVPIVGMTAYVVSAAGSLPGAESVFGRLTSLARQGDAENFSRFFDILFEVEVAVYFSTMQGAAEASFEPSSHPDLWVHPHGLAHAAATPVECKRISPLGPTKQTFRRLRKRLKSAVGQLGESIAAGDSGIVAIRIRPPSSQDELLRIDETIRNGLRNPRVGFVELFWNTAESTAGGWLYDAIGHPVRTRKEAYRLVPYRIRNSDAARDLTPHDSAPRVFPERERGPR